MSEEGRPPPGSEPLTRKSLHHLHYYNSWAASVIKKSADAATESAGSDSGHEKTNAATAAGRFTYLRFGGFSTRGRSQRREENRSKLNCRQNPNSADWISGGYGSKKRRKGGRWVLPPESKTYLTYHSFYAIFFFTFFLDGLHCNSILCNLPSISRPSFCLSSYTAINLHPCCV